MLPQSEFPYDFIQNVWKHSIPQVTNHCMQYAYHLISGYLVIDVSIRMIFLQQMAPFHSSNPLPKRPIRVPVILDHKRQPSQAE